MNSFHTLLGVIAFTARWAVRVLLRAVAAGMD